MIAATRLRMSTSRLIAVRRTLGRTQVVRAPRSVRLPAQLLRIRATTPISCSAGQFVASQAGPFEVTGDGLAIAAQVLGEAAVDRHLCVSQQPPKRALGRPSATLTLCLLSCLASATVA